MLQSISSLILLAFVCTCSVGAQNTSTTKIANETTTTTSDTTGNSPTLLFYVWISVAVALVVVGLVVVIGLICFYCCHNYKPEPRKLADELLLANRMAKQTLPPEGVLPPPRYAPNTARVVSAIDDDDFKSPVEMPFLATRKSSRLSDEKLVTYF